MRTTIVILGIALGAAWLLFASDQDNDTWRPDLQFAEVTQGPLKHYVTASGTVEALTTVEISSQISGQIKEVFVDFNDRVVVGQVLAQLDDSLFRASVQEAAAKAMLANAQADCLPMNPLAHSTRKAAKLLLPRWRG